MASTIAKGLITNDGRFMREKERSAVEKQATLVMWKVSLFIFNTFKS